MLGHASQDFLKPVVAPYDVWMALAGCGVGWGGVGGVRSRGQARLTPGGSLASDAATLPRHVTDLAQLQQLLHAAADRAEAGGPPSEAGGSYSFLTGTYRATTRAAEPEAIEDGDRALARRDGPTAVTAYTARASPPPTPHSGRGSLYRSRCARWHAQRTIWPDGSFAAWTRDWARPRSPSPSRGRMASPAATKASPRPHSPSLEFVAAGTDS
jgi:hypothetical protein